MIAAVDGESSDNDRASPSRASLGPQAPHRPHRARDRARRRDGQRHVRPDGHDQRRRSRRSSTSSFENSDAVDQRQGCVQERQQQHRRNAGLAGRVLAKVSAPDVARRRGSERRDQAKLIGRDGKVISTERRPRSRVEHRPRHLRFSPLKLSSGRWPVGSGQIVIDKRHAQSRKHFAIGDTIGVAADEGRSSFQDLRHRDLRRRLVHRRVDDRGLRRADRAAAVREGRQAGRDPGRSQGRRDGGQTRRRDPAARCRRPRR